MSLKMGTGQVTNDNVVIEAWVGPYLGLLFGPRTHSTLSQAIAPWLMGFQSPLAMPKAACRDVLICCFHGRRICSFGG